MDLHLTTSFRVHDFREDERIDHEVDCKCWLRIEFVFYVIKHFWDISDDVTQIQLRLRDQEKVDYKFMIWLRSNVVRYELKEFSELILEEFNSHKVPCSKHEEIIDDLTKCCEGLSPLVDTSRLLAEKKIIALTVDIQAERTYMPNQMALTRMTLERTKANDSAGSTTTDLPNSMEEKVPENCVICLEEINNAYNFALMPCSHYFHAYCITKWLDRSQHCPLCRFYMPVLD